MVTSFLMALLGALWFGILTTLHPCPLASNIASVMLLGSRYLRPGQRGLGAFLYILGRITAYLLVGAVLAAGFLTAGPVRRFLQEYYLSGLGPFLILAGMMMSGLLGGKYKGRLLAWLDRKFFNAGSPLGSAGAFFLGFLLSLAFCPATAALFFGVVMPSALYHQSVFLIPLVYGLGAAIPVVGFAVLFAGGSDVMARRMKITALNSKISFVAGIVLIGVGIYFVLDALINVI